VDRRLAVALAARALGLDRRGLQSGIDKGYVRVVNWIFFYGFPPPAFRAGDSAVVNRCTGRTIVRRWREK
jgi:hypothetical protein